MELRESLIERYAVLIALPLAWMALCSIAVLVTIVVCEFTRLRDGFSTVVAWSRRLVVAGWALGQPRK